jgi:DNA gyrase/topoisomerase IV subunit B
MSKQKEIVALSEVNHIRLRPGMYISTVDVTDEKLILIKDNLLKTETKQMSIGFYKLLNEILDNGFDALKRDKITNGKITLKVYSENSKVIVSDSAYGFYEPSKINSTSGLSNVETAVSMLRAGSNFYNDDIEDNLIGTNGVGSAVVNMLSDYFKIVTINKEEIYSHV